MPPLKIGRKAAMIASAMSGMGLNRLPSVTLVANSLTLQERCWETSGKRKCR